MTRLPDDVCRCHDTTCPERENCRRWLNKDSGGVRVVHAASLRETTGPDGTCTRRIPVVLGAAA